MRRLAAAALLLMACPKPAPAVIDAGEVAAVPDAHVEAPGAPDAGVAEAPAEEAPQEPEERTLYENTLDGDFLAIRDGGLEPVGSELTARLSCTTKETEAEQQERNHKKCDAALDLLARDRSVFASSLHAPDGMDFEVAAGNSTELGLDVFALTEDNGLIRTSADVHQGDMSLTVRRDDTLWAVKGEALVAVLEVTTFYERIPAPDEQDVKVRREMALAPGKKRTNGVLNIIGTTHVTDNGKDSTEYTTFVWNGAKYVDKKTLSK
jgi:nucleoid-associated protein YgaU